MTEPSPALERQRHKLLAEITTLGFALPGTLTQRHTRCSSEGCRCHADPPTLHGPYQTWTRKIAGKTVTRQLTAQQAARYAPWFENARKLRALITELETLSLHAADQTHGWGRK
jgi:hypothetical protein